MNRVLFHGKKKRKQAYPAQIKTTTAVRGYDPDLEDEYTKEARNVEVDVSAYSVRVLLERPGCEDNGDIMLEWRPDGWHVLVWCESGTDPIMHIRLPDTKTDPVATYEAEGRFCRPGNDLL